MHLDLHTRLVLKAELHHTGLAVQQADTANAHRDAGHKALLAVHTAELAVVHSHLGCSSNRGAEREERHSLGRRAAVKARRSLDVDLEAGRENASVVGKGYDVVAARLLDPMRWVLGRIAVVEDLGCSLDYGLRSNRCLTCLLE